MMIPSLSGSPGIGATRVSSSPQPKGYTGWRGYRSDPAGTRPGLVTTDAGCTVRRPGSLREAAAGNLAADPRAGAPPLQQSRRYRGDGAGNPADAASGAPFLRSGPPVLPLAGGDRLAPKHRRTAPPD